MQRLEEKTKPAQRKLSERAACFKRRNVLKKMVEGCERFHRPAGNEEAENGFGSLADDN